MGFGFRKSINLGGGVRLNFSKKGVGISAGVKGLRAGIGPSGARMRASIPGTGIYHEERLGTKNKGKKINEKTSSASTQQQQHINLGFFQKLGTPQEEVSFIDGVNLILSDDKNAALPKFQDAVNKNTSFADAYFCMALITDGKQQLDAINAAIDNKKTYGKFFQKYKVFLGTTLSITDELKVQITNDNLGLILLAAEIYQENDLHNDAIKLLEDSDYTNDQAVILSLGELFYDAGKYEDSIRMLQQLENNDSVGTTALLYQGLAFREIQRFDASIEVLKSALKRKKGRSDDLLLEARYQLAYTYETAGDIKKAQKEYEKILTDRLDYKDVNERIKV